MYIKTFTDSKYNVCPFVQNRYDLQKVEVNQLYTRLLVKLPPAPKMEKKKKSWIDTAGGSIKNVVDGAFKNMAGVVADKVIIILRFLIKI